nr:hypothetical protein [Propionibacterium sp.]
MSGNDNWTQPDSGRSDPAGWRRAQGDWSPGAAWPSGGTSPQAGGPATPYDAPYPQYRQPSFGPPAPGFGSTPQPYLGQPGYQQPGYAVAPYGHSPYGQPVVAPKSPGVALLASFFVPGLGSMINGQVGKGIGILVGYIVSLLLVWLLLPGLVALGLWVWGMVDAYQGAQRWNLEHGILS